MSMKRFLSLTLALLLLCGAALSAAEEADVLTLNLATATDEELADAAARIRAEQKSRMKTAIVLEPAGLTLTKGSSAKVSAEVTGLADGVTAGEFVWESSDSGVAAWNRGSVKGAEGGSAVITCTAALSDGTEVSAELPVTVTVPVQGIAAKPNKIEVMAGETFVPALTFKPENATDKGVVYASSDEAVVKPDGNGQLLAVAPGKASVTVTAADGSKKTARVAVTVTKRVGKFDGELTFQGLEWGSDFETCWKRLQDAGFVDPEQRGYVYGTGSMHYWPEQDLLFAHYGSWQNLPVVFGDKGVGAARSGMSPLKKVGGFSPRTASLYFLNGIGEDGNVDGGITRLTGVYFYFDNDHERGAEIFVSLLTKMEAQYGEFDRYLAKDFTRRFYKDTYDVIKGSMAGAEMYTYRSLNRDPWLSNYAICVLHGKNDTGIMLMMDTSENVTLFYGKTDTLRGIREIQTVLEAVPDDREDAGI